MIVLSVGVSGLTSGIFPSSFSICSPVDILSLIINIVYTDHRKGKTHYRKWERELGDNRETRGAIPRQRRGSEKRTRTGKFPKMSFTENFSTLASTKDVKAIDLFLFPALIEKMRRER